MKWVKNKQKLDKSDWHLWFAWKPVTVLVYPDGNEKKAWMTTVLRRYILDPGKPGIGVGPFWKPEYKERPEIKVTPMKMLMSRERMRELIKNEPEEASIPLGPKVTLFDRDQTFEEWEEEERKIAENLNFTGEGLDHETHIISSEEAEKRWKENYPEHHCTNCPDKGNTEECMECMDVDDPENCEFKSEDGSSCIDKELGEKAKELYSHPVEVNWRKKHGKTIM